MAKARVTKTKKENKSSSIRNYDNSARAEKSNQTQQSIIDNLVHLLVEKRGGEVSMQELAKKTGITQRTIFRFFKDKQSLHAAMNQYLMSYLAQSAEQLQNLNFVDFGKNTYALFDKHESLTLAYLFSPFGQEARILFRKKLTQMMVQKILQEKKLALTPQRRTRLAVVTSLISAHIWNDIRTDFNLNGTEMSAAVAWALQTLIDHC